MRLFDHFFPSLHITTIHLLRCFYGVNQLVPVPLSSVCMCHCRLLSVYQFHVISYMCHNYTEFSASILCSEVSSSLHMLFVALLVSC